MNESMKWMNIIDEMNESYAGKNLSNVSNEDFKNKADISGISGALPTSIFTQESGKFFVRNTDGSLPDNINPSNVWSLADQSSSSTLPFERVSDRPPLPLLLTPLSSTLPRPLPLSLSAPLLALVRQASGA